MVKKYTTEDGLSLGDRDLIPDHEENARQANVLVERTKQQHEAALEEYEQAKENYYKSRNKSPVEKKKLADAKRYSDVTAKQLLRIWPRER